MKITNIVSLLLFAFVGLFVFASCYDEAKAVTTNVVTPIDEKSDWYSIQDVESLQKKSSKKVIVDVYTDWCKWCKVMDQKTFSDQKLMEELKKDYHLVKFNAETKTPIQFKGKTYDFVKNGRRGYNKLAVELVGARMSYPSFVVLDENLNTLKVIKGFKNSEALKAALN